MSPRERTDADLSTCDREPIHIPGSIQPHGVLLSLDEPGLKIVQCSANASAVFKRDVSEILGGSLADLLGAQAEPLVHALNTESLDRNPLLLGTILVSKAGAERQFHAVAHRYRNSLILEFEETAPSGPLFQNLYPLVRNFMTSLQSISAIPELAKAAADEVRRIAGFDRVLIYRFDPDWHGHVIAESLGGDLPSYMDLWFPASDIPAQARELYRLNRIRLIADAHYRPIPLMPELDPRTNSPLDLSYSSLRSVSPVHIEYLHNMGIAASMSISIIQNNRLWGMISLHHKQPRVLPYEARVACDFLGQAFSTHLTARETQAEYEHRLYLKTITSKLLGFMAEEEQFINGLTNHPDELLSFANAEGAAVLFEGKCTMVGKTPPETEVLRLVDWLSSQGQQEVFHTDQLASVLPGYEALYEAASGILAISISKLYQSYVVWFRPEVVRTVKWGGDPRKPVESATEGRIHPRKSFDTWKETVRGHSVPWRQSEIESAVDLRTAVVGVVLRKAEELAALSAELKRSNSELEAFSYSVSHDLRAPFRHIMGYADLLRDHLGKSNDETTERFLVTISQAAESAGDLVDSLLNFARVGRAKVQPVPIDMAKLVREVEREVASHDDRQIQWDVAKLPPVQADPPLIRLVWQNLLSNALKYTRATPEPRISVGSYEDDHEIVFFVRDNGVGFKQQYAGKLFGVFQRLHAADEYEGTGIGLANVRRAIGKHGGRTWAEGELGKGASFYFSLPRRISGNHIDA